MGHSFLGRNRESERGFLALLAKRCPPDEGSLPVQPSLFVQHFAFQTLVKKRRPNLPGYNFFQLIDLRLNGNRSRSAAAVLHRTRSRARSYSNCAKGQQIIAAPPTWRPQKGLGKNTIAGVAGQAEMAGGLDYARGSRLRNQNQV
jgi:hypothetical protein